MAARRDSQRLIEYPYAQSFEKYLSQYSLSADQFEKLFDDAHAGFLKILEDYDGDHDPYEVVKTHSEEALWLVFGEYMHKPDKIKADAEKCMRLNLDIEEAIFKICDEAFWDRENYDKMEPILRKFIRLNLPCRSCDPNDREQDDEHTKLKELILTECREYLDADSDEDEELWKQFKSLFGDPFFLVQDGPRNAMYYLCQTSYNSVKERLYPLHNKDLPKHDDGELIAKAYNGTSDVRRHTWNDMPLVSKKIPHFIFSSNQWTKDYPPHEIATHRILESHHCLNPLTPLPCPYIIGLIGVTKSDAKHEPGIDEEVFDYYYYTEGGISYFDWIAKNFKGCCKKWRKILERKKKEGDKSHYKTNKSEWEIARTKDFIKMLTAIKFMHVQEIAHRDLKLENVVFVGGKQQDAAVAEFGADCKIIDFGVNQRFSAVDPNMKVLDQKGTQTYMSPECFNVRFPESVDFEIEKVDDLSTYDAEKNDVWTLGCMLFSMLTAKPAYHSCENCCPYFRMATGGSFLEEGKKEKSHSLKSLLKGMKRHFCVTNLGVEFLESLFCPEKVRLTIDELFEHPWLNDCGELNDLIRSGRLDCLLKVYPQWKEIKDSCPFDLENLSEMAVPMPAMTMKASGNHDP